MSVQLCAGIDPNPDEITLTRFLEMQRKHEEFLDAVKPKFVKPNLGFYLRYGSRGLQVLEEFVARYRNSTRILLDCKWNEIDKTLNAYLDFAFGLLRVHGVTLNPFLGEGSLSQAAERVAKCAGADGRLYVLCATSQGGTRSLKFFQDNYKQTLKACIELRDNLVAQSLSLKHLVGVVVGANHSEILQSQELLQSGLSVLAPGLGAQGADTSIVRTLKETDTSCEILFPMSRGIFADGNLPLSAMIQNYKNAQALGFGD